MKRFIILAITILILVLSALAADTSKVLALFRASYPNATHIHYKITGDLVSIQFVHEGIQLNAYYNEDGDQIALSRVIPYKQLPLQALTTIKKRFPAYTPAETIEMEHSVEGTSYYAALENDKEKVIVIVSRSGDVNVFKRMRK